jgi:RimJ/RimL family protein N-acetyltransferase
MSVAPTVELSVLTAPVLRALLIGDLEAASRTAGLRLPPVFLEDGPLWLLRIGQIDADPAAEPWLIRAIAVPDGEVVGHAGYHGPPDERGMVEVGYFVLEAHRRRGYARAALQGLIGYAAQQRARVVRASVSPDNAPSLELVRSSGFVHIGEQWDDEDGLELVFERSLVTPDAR